MGERTDGTWAARRVGLSVPRQNGKSQLLVARALAGALLFGERKIVISAHQQDVARESFTKLMEIIDADANASLRARVKSVMNALNREHVKFANGATIQFKARSGSGSRGFSSDCLMLDEAQILSQRAWVSINSTMSAMPNPQVWLLGTPPTPEDDGEVFGSVRSSAMSGQSTAVAWLEWAADPTADPALEHTRWSANPAWNVRLNHEVVQGEFETYPADRFALDRLGVWASDEATTVIPWSSWEACKQPAAPMVGPIILAVEASLDRSDSAIAVVGGREGSDKPQVTIADRVRREEGDNGSDSGTLPAGRRLVERVLQIVRDNDDIAAVVVDEKSPCAPQIDDLRDALEALGVELVTVSTAADLAEACAQMFDAVIDGELIHWDNPRLNASVRTAVQQPMGDAWKWSRRKGGTQVAPVIAATLGLWLWRQRQGLDYDIEDSLG